MKTFILFATLLFIHSSLSGQSQSVLLQNVTLIDGTGKPPRNGVDVLIRAGKIDKIGVNLSAKGARKLNLKGKTLMPTLVSAHNHIGMFEGTSTGTQFYTRTTILRQLKQFQMYGVGTLLTLGTDRPLIFEGLRDSSMTGLLPGARLFSAGYGFRVFSAKGNFEKDRIYYPRTPEEASEQVALLARLRPTAVKMWVDDFGGSSPKMQPEIYSVIIREAHQHQLQAAAHLYYLEDAHRLVDAGLDIIAHSIRDQEVDGALLQKMKEKNVIYIPTLALDKYAYVYAHKPKWINDPFFRASLEPGVYDMITSRSYQDNIRNNPSYNRNITAFKMAMVNLEKIFKAGVRIALGTDSGAFPVRTIGFSEHLELELMTQAGLSPLEAIQAGTKNAAIALKVDHELGTLEVGKKADFLVLSANPALDIKNTRQIEAVWKEGTEVSKGPLGTPSR